MSTPQKTPPNTAKKVSQTEELKTEPMSERDEFKEAERKMAKIIKKTAKVPGGKKS